MDRDFNFLRKSLDSPDRQYETTGEVEITIPDYAEHAREWFDPRLKRVRRSNGTEGFQWYAKITPSAMMAHVDNKGTVALITNVERYPSGRASRELPGGAIDVDLINIFDDLTPEEQMQVFKDTAIREAVEEIGMLFTEKDVRPLFKGPLQGSVSLLDHQCQVFEGYGGTFAETHHDDGEKGLLMLGRYALSDTEAMIGHEITEPFTAASVLKLHELYGSPMKRLKTKVDRFTRGIIQHRDAA